MVISGESQGSGVKVAHTLTQAVREGTSPGVTLTLLGPFELGRCDLRRVTEPVSPTQRN